jgi:hypothetical protein
MRMCAFVCSSKHRAPSSLHSDPVVREAINENTLRKDQRALCVATISSAHGGLAASPEGGLTFTLSVAATSSAVIHDRFIGSSLTMMASLVADHTEMPVDGERTLEGSREDRRGQRGTEL